MNDIERYARHERLFGAEGQEKIASTRVAIIGLGGLGCHVAQQLAYLGVVDFVLADHDVVTRSSLNRLVGATQDDIDAPKVDIASRMITAIQPNAEVAVISKRFDVDSPLELEGERGVLFGCVDDDVDRLEILKRASAYALPYIDLASDITTDGIYGGRIVFAKDGERCLSCLGELDQHVLARAQMTNEQRAADDAIYGIDRNALDTGGPSVISINGAVASLAVTEFMAWRTGLRSPIGFLSYRGDLGTVRSRVDPERSYCAYCMTFWGSGAK
jgi:molybdopterin/thiamine biosynthesis adenylyltransferase